mmetsp:Transcript_12188/g.23307  ORF Transcript_12188/g.23307 Transcript_12188/m.23307 type:complete len:493 (-) Transcript_12188:11-1489(-)
MRYKSNREAAAATPVRASTPSGPLKKDGTPDMRYKSNRDSSFSSTSTTSTHSGPLKKDGTLDMRYKINKDSVNSTSYHDSSGSLGSKMKNMRLSSDGIPLRKDGLPDMRFKASREWMAKQNVDAGAARVKYVKERKQEPEYLQIFQNVQICCQASNFFCPPAEPVIVETDPIPRSMIEDRGEEVKEPSLKEMVPSDLRLITEDDLTYAKDAKPVGRGAFGVVHRAKLDGKEDVAVKKLHLALNKKDKKSFVDELRVMAKLGNHPNIVALKGYMLDPPAIVMEYVEYGSLHHLLYHDEDPERESYLQQKEVKKKLLYGITSALMQLHMIRAVHGDIKPQNILVTSDWDAKLCDFGMVKLRGKASASVASSALEGKDSEGGNAAGTAAYMAPELLGDAVINEKTDIYSFGILANELLSELEPYQDSYHKFAGKGPFAAVLHASQGNRPKLAKEQCKFVQDLIESCWSKDPSARPPADKLLEHIALVDFAITPIG